MKRLFVKYFWSGLFQRWTFISLIEVIYFGTAYVFFRSDTTIYFFSFWISWFLMTIFLQIWENIRNKKRERETIEILNRYIVTLDGMSGTMGTGGISKKRDFKFGR